MERPDWDTYFLYLAKVIATRSHDSQTKHGCVIVNEDNQILATGYNGFVRGIDDIGLPTTRPEKYPWMLHGEVNALSNRTCSVKGATVYVTSSPCFACYQYMEQCGIKKVIYQKSLYSYGWIESERKNLEEFHRRTKLQINPIEVDFTKVTNILNDANLNK